MVSFSVSVVPMPKQNIGLKLHPEGRLLIKETLDSTENISANHLCPLASDQLIYVSCFSFGVLKILVINFITMTRFACSTMGHNKVHK